MTHYDFLIVGSGLFGATFAYRAKQADKTCLVIDKRPHLGGNVYCEQSEGINVHKYGAHIFHTANKSVWDFVNTLVPFNRYTNCPVANFHGELYNLPFNMNTLILRHGSHHRTSIESRSTDTIILCSLRPNSIRTSHLRPFPEIAFGFKTSSIGLDVIQQGVLCSRFL